MAEVKEVDTWKQKALNQAKLDAEKGEFISHKAIGEWLYSLGTKHELDEPKVDIFKNKP